MKRIIKYPASVEKASPKFINKDLKLTNKKTNYRIKLTVKSIYKNSINNVLVLMMNPSKANSNMSDKTTNKLISTLNNNFFYFKNLISVNVMPLVQPDSDELNNINEKLLSINVKYIKGIMKTIKNNTIILIATGDLISKPTIRAACINSYNNIMNYIYNEQDNFNIYRFENLSNHFFGHHPGSIELGYKLKKTKIYKCSKKYGEITLKYRLK